MKHTNGLLRFAALLMTAVVLLSMIPALSASAADRNSFSCANLLPCIAQEYRIPIIGETSGGGTCFLLDLSLPDATAFSLSG